MGAGSAANPHLFFDNLTLTYKEAVIKSELKSTIDNITKKNEVLNNSDLASAIATAQGVYDNASATQSEVNTATANLNAAFETAKKSMSDNLNVTTLFVQNNSFETGNGNGWTFNIASDTGVKPNSNGTYTTSGIDGSYLFNTWDGTTTQKYVKQTLTNLPEGYYQLSVLYASDANLTADIINGDTRTKATATGKGTFVPVTTGKVYVADGGSLEIGATSATWYKVDNFQLTYFTVTTAARETYDQALAAAQAALSNESYASVAGTERTSLVALTQAAEPSTVAEFAAATSTLQTATAAFTGAKASYDALAAAKTTVVPELPYASADAKTAVASAQAAEATTAAEASAQAAAITTALRAYYESNAKAEGVDGAADFTSAIANPVGTSTSGWTTDKGVNQKGSIGILSSQSWTSADGAANHSYFDGGSWGDNAWDVTFSQTITLPAGRYLLSAMARAHANLNTFQLIGGDQKADMPHVGDTGSLFNRGWASNYVVFESIGNPVTIGVFGKAVAINQWMSFADFKLYRIGDIAASDVTISENEAYSPEAAYANVTLNRTINAGKWNTFVVPFDLSNEELKAAFGSDVAVAEFSENSADPENATVNFNTMTTPAITANKPVLLQTSVAGTQYTFNGKTIKAGDVKVPGTNFSFVGSYEASKTLDNTCYFISSNVLYKSEGQTTLAGTRAYIAPNMAAAGKITGFSIDGQYTTGIEGIKAADSANAPIYNINGQRVNKASKGVYIQNGKKFVVK